MKQPVPAELRNPTNKSVLDHLDGKSAHSDIAEALRRAVTTLGDVQISCPDPEHYGYVAVSTFETIFGVAFGMNIIAFRLAAVLKARALKTGASNAPEMGREWVAFELFQDDWPEIDIKFWAQKAYVFARET